MVPWSTTRRRPGSRPRPPLAGGRFDLRVALSLLRDPLDFLLRCHQRHGDIFEVHAASRRFVVLAGQAANRFAGAEGRDAFESTSFWGKLADHRSCPHLILNQDGPEHLTQRKHYGDVLSRRMVDEHRQGCDRLVRETFGDGPGSLVPVQDQARLLVARLVHHCLTQGAAPIPEETARSLLEVFRWETNALLLGKWPRIALRAPTYRRHFSRAEAFISELVKAEQSTSELGGWFERVRQGHQRLPELFSGGDQRMALLLPFVAGVDTVGSTLGFVLACLGRDAELAGAVRAEVDAAYSAAGGPPDVEGLRALPNLYGVALECLRLFPAAFSMYRGAARDFEFAGCHVAKGEHVVLFTSATHFDERYFPDPTRFDVSRYRTPRLEHRQKHVFMPYGAGPHVCLGASMGEGMLLLAAASILRHHPFRLERSERALRRVYDPSLTVHPSLRLSLL